MPSEVRFVDLSRLLESHGWTLTRISGSHHVFTKPGRSHLSIPVHGKKVKPVYARRVEKVLREDASPPPDLRLARRGD